MDEKQALRSRLVAARGALAEAEREAAGRRLRDFVLSLPEVAMAGTVAAYYSTGTEPSTHGLVYALFKRGSYVLLPVLRQDSDLDWASYEGPSSLTPGRHGLLEPVDSRRGVAAVSSADVVIVPALAVDRSGNRLGRGGGSFDRALARVGGSVLTIALLYDTELVSSLPFDSHDQPVRAVVRPGHGITRLAGRLCLAVAPIEC